MYYVKPKRQRLSRIKNNFFEVISKFQLTLTSSNTSGDPLSPSFLVICLSRGDCITCLFRDMIRACALPADYFVDLNASLNKETLCVKHALRKQRTFPARKQKNILPQVKNDFTSRTQILSAKHMFSSLATMKTMFIRSQCCLLKM